MVRKLNILDSFISNNY